jgi:glycosyltransferase involved in cell wall biosynthesis
VKGPPLPAAALEPSTASGEPPVRVVRIISRLNIGGPAIQAITLTKLLEPAGYRTTLVRGREGPREGSMDYLADDLGVVPVTIASLRRDPGAHDLWALLALIRELRHVRPDIIHTHLAKAGAIGRLAALVAFKNGCRPVVVHTYHGHSLAGYFSGLRNALFVRIERWLARSTQRLIAVSEEVRDDLVRVGVAPRERFEVVRVGFDLSRFVVEDTERVARRAALREEIGIMQDARIVTFVGRFVPIKRVDRFLRVAAKLRTKQDIRFLIVGDGELRDEVRASEEARTLEDRIVWTGFRRDMADVYFASDVVVQTSDNEGTPVALVEAQAAGVPVVSTRVGGVTSVVLENESGRVVPVDDEGALSDAVDGILADQALAADMGAAGQRHVLATFSLERLVSAVAELYRRLLGETGGGVEPVADRDPVSSDGAI